MEKLSIKRLLMFALGVMLRCVVFGQQVRVSGTVTDAADGTTLPGVHVVVKGSLVGAITGVNGEFSLSAKPGDVLVFTFIGYLPQEITLG
ncbi:MAG TPA: carboxypeptidase-like regulatory domain-containing protein, partial [Bacteroidales bacterium]|nr:carboxypeptidase-like regulatory domain-containing protein [Bacteroidales bacterium]